MYYTSVMIITVFDTETSGLPEKGRKTKQESSKWPYIVQLSWLTYNSDNGTIVEIKDYIIKLPRGVLIDEKSSEIHGITKDMTIEKGENIKMILVEFSEVLKNTDILVAHNINFDKNMIEVECYRNGYHNILKEHNNIEYCTMKFGDHITKLTRVDKNNLIRPKYPKLMELYQHLFKEMPQNLHNSLVDVMVCFRCFYYMYFGSDIVEKDEYVKNKIHELC